MRILFTLLILCAGCTAQQKQLQPRVHHKDFLKFVKNACVTKNDMDDMHFCFKNGIYQEKGVDEEGQPYHIEINLLSPIVFAYFKTDTLEYAIAPMVYDGGGNGVIYLLLLFVYKNNSALQLGYANILEDGHLDSVRVNQDTVMVDMSNTPSTEDGKETISYVFRQNVLSPTKK